ncbi:longevity assurance proteins LAG1/LAC1 [Atractiella rhizophila]|nr:longevity assurance proteins LAG1/LAC1 [Atractiella rhizophila]
MSDRRTRRSSSLVQYLQDPPGDHHVNHLGTVHEDAIRGRHHAKPKRRGDVDFISDLISQKWIIHPESSFKLLLLIALSFALFEYPLKPFVESNPILPLIFPSYRLDPQPEDTVPKYGKGAKDILLLLFGIVFFSFLRESFTQWVCRPFAEWMGIKSEAKLARFKEQAYTVLYFSCSSIAGFYVMSRTQTWWYDTKHFWLDYPQWRMNFELKAYYLAQFSYWLHQAIVMLLMLEKPRSDFYELVGHHVVTLWLIGWSYLINLNQIGVAIFVTMDFSDAVFASAKCCNYLKYSKTANTIFVFFIGTWSYFRIYQNVRILHSVWYEFDLIPEDTVWYFLIWRVAMRTVFRGESAEDEREEGEDDDEEDKKDK